MSSALTLLATTTLTKWSPLTPALAKVYGAPVDTSAGATARLQIDALTTNVDISIETGPTASGPWRSVYEGSCVGQPTNPPAGSFNISIVGLDAFTRVGYRSKYEGTLTIAGTLL